MTTPAAPLCRCGAPKVAIIHRAGDSYYQHLYTPPSAGETREAAPRKHEHTYACAATDCEAVVGPAAEPAGGQEPPDPAKYADDAYGNRMLRRDLAAWEEMRETNAGLGRFFAFKELGDWHDYRANEIRGELATAELSRQRREEMEQLADEHDECARHHRGEPSKFAPAPKPEPAPASVGEERWIPHHTEASGACCGLGADDCPCSCHAYQRGLEAGAREMLTNVIKALCPDHKRGHVLDNGRLWGGCGARRLCTAEGLTEGQVIAGSLPWPPEPPSPTEKEEK